MVPESELGIDWENDNYPELDYSNFEGEDV